MDTGETGVWLTLSEAGRILGISKKTVRRRLARRELEGRQVSTPFGETWEVWVSPLSGDLSTGNGRPTPTTRPQDHINGQGVSPLELLRMLDDRDRTIMELAGRVGFYQGRAQDLEARLLMLEAPKPEPVAVEPTPEPEAAPGGVMKRWWRFW